MKRSLKTLTSLSIAGALAGTQLLVPTAPAQSQTAINATGCPAGTREAGQNRIINGNFATASGIVATPTGDSATIITVPGGLGFTSTLPYRGDFGYPNDTSAAGVTIGGLSIQDLSVVPITGNPAYNPAILSAVPFPGDPTTNTPPSTRFLYSNPNASFIGGVLGGAGSAYPDPVIWRQTVTGLTPGTIYNFKVFFYNLINQAGFTDPLISLRIGPPGVPSGTATSITNDVRVPNNSVQTTWLPVQGSFRTAAAGPGSNSLDVIVVDRAQLIAVGGNPLVGDDFGFTAIGVRECVPTLGVAKAAGAPVNNGNGTFTVPYTVTVRNFAPAALGAPYDLVSLQLSDDLTTTFAAASSFRIQPGSIRSTSTPALTVNPNFSGITTATNPRGNDLLLGSDILPAGSSATVTFNVILTPGTGPNGFGVFSNQVTATATSRGGTPLQAQSNNGTNPADPNNPNQPAPPSRTPVQLPPLGGGGTGNVGTPSLRLVKRITRVTRNGAPLPGVNFSTFIKDPTSNNDSAPGWAQFPPFGQINLDGSTPLISGDEVTYTVYYLSDGTGTAQAVNICDPIPSGTTFVQGSTQVKQAAGPAFAGGAFFPPLVPLPANNSCPNQTNQNGSVLFSVGDVPNTAGNNFGFVSFRVKIN
jgi:uncharacterized repeat protein (TIGR01451 family)